LGDFLSLCVFIIARHHAFVNSFFYFFYQSFLIDKKVSIAGKCESFTFSSISIFFYRLALAYANQRRQQAAAGVDDT
jgi:hypothetical protein